jgi:hypothetical protein
LLQPIRHAGIADRIRSLVPPGDDGAAHVAMTSCSEPNSHIDTVLGGLVEALKVPNPNLEAASEALKYARKYSEAIGYAYRAATGAIDDFEAHVAALATPQGFTVTATNDDEPPVETDPTPDEEVEESSPIETIPEPEVPVKRKPGRPPNPNKS